MSFDMAYFSSGGIRFYYEVLGEGAPLLYSHGLGGDARRIRDFVNQLPGIRAIIYDNRGHGRTAPLGDSSALTFQQMADDMADLLDHLSISDAWVGGASMGAGVALAFALQRAQRVRGLILNRPAWLDAPCPANLAFAPLMADLVERHGADGAAVAFEKTAYYRSMLGISPGTAESLLSILKESDPQALMATYRSIPLSTPVDTIQRLRGLQVPALVIGNRDDPIHPLSIAEAWAGFLPNAHLKVIPSRFLDPAEHLFQFRAAVRGFLDARISAARTL